ncbi:polymerase (RNA) II (DNA directed) polypeptide G, isoform CRA_b [Mus musculus]|nr:polymerase (RNA) II (DNA directed) polypeptide G, isoform CRA_b [Mus musculus]
MFYHVSWMRDFPGARDPPAPTILRSKLAQHGEAEAVYRGGGDLHWEIWLCNCCHHHRQYWCWCDPARPRFCSLSSEIQSYCFPAL